MVISKRHAAELHDLGPDELCGFWSDVAAVGRALTALFRPVKIDNLVMIAHNNSIGGNCLMSGQVGISGSCRIGDRVVLAGQTGVADHLSIGDDAAFGGDAQHGLRGVSVSAARVLGMGQGVKALHQRQSPALSQLAADPATHPVVGVEHLDLVQRRMCRHPEVEGAQVRREGLFAQGRRAGLTVLRPVQPMLAQTAPDVTEALALATGRKPGDDPGPASVEWKLDGARIQVHRTGDAVRIFTRNLNDVTDRLPGIVDLVRSLPARALVLDGEAMGVDEDELPRMFQDTMSAFGRRTEGPRGHPGADLRSRFFDLLHLDGDDLIDRPLTERLAALERVAGRWRVPGVVTTDAAEAQRVLDESLATGHEGVMVKDATSTYDAGRRGGAWRKVKPVHTLDLVVLAVEWGSGRRQGWLSNLHLGARDPASGDLVMVGKTFKGLTDELLAWQTERFLALETGRDGHVVWLRPEQVVEIALNGVQRSTRYPGGVALRFARVRRYRDDKGPDEADTIDAVRALRAGATTPTVPPAD